jgi:hypothetical protein
MKRMEGISLLQPIWCQNEWRRADPFANVKQDMGHWKYAPFYKGNYSWGDSGRGIDDASDNGRKRTYRAEWMTLQRWEINVVIVRTTDV